MGCRRHASGHCGAGAVPVADCGHRLTSREMTARIGHVFPLKDAAKAHRIVETGHSGGKVILIP